jgi:hypothetical protein
MPKDDDSPQALDVEKKPSNLFRWLAQELAPFRMLTFLAIGLTITQSVVVFIPPLISAGNFLFASFKLTRSNTSSTLFCFSPFV